MLAQYVITCYYIIGLNLKGDLLMSEWIKDNGITGVESWVYILDPHQKVPPSLACLAHLKKDEKEIAQFRGPSNLTDEEIIQFVRNNRENWGEGKFTLFNDEDIYNPKIIATNDELK